MGLWVTRQLKKLSTEKKTEEKPSNLADLVSYFQRLLEFLSSEVKAYGSIEVDLKDDGEGFGHR